LHLRKLRLVTIPSSFVLGGFSESAHIVRLLNQFDEAMGTRTCRVEIGPLVIKFIQLRGAQAWEIKRVFLAREVEEQQLGNELAIWAEGIFILVARIQPKWQLEFGLALLPSGQPDHERAKITGPSIPNLLARKCGTSPESDKQVADFVGPVRLYEYNGEPSFLEGLAEFLGQVGKPVTSPECESGPKGVRQAQLLVIRRESLK
jgi:hypothetical protein